MISVEEHGDISVVRLENGPVNVLDLDLLRALTETFRSRAGAGALVLTGAGRAFSAGVDLQRILDGGHEYAAAFLPALSTAFRTVFDHPRPVVAAVNGHAIAGGCILVAACDIRLMSAGTIGVTELRVGVPFPPSALETLRFAVGPAMARLVLTGQTLSAADAAAVGLVDEVVDPAALLDEALSRARQLASIPAETFTLTKAQLRRRTSERIDADEKVYADQLIDVWTGEPARRAIGRYLDQLRARRANGSAAR
jgi:enoyl-CoA hydratase/carnithine racemase